MVYDRHRPVCRLHRADPGSSLITRQTDGNGKVTYFKYDALDRLIKQVRKSGDTADTDYAERRRHVYAYDPTATG